MKLVHKEYIEDETNYYDITVQNHHNFVLSNGAVAHNCGTGVGFSVERQFINRLPEVAEEFHNVESTIVVRDSKIGWAAAFRQLVSFLYNGHIPEWDVSKIRPAGERLKTFGGRASGPEPLVDLFRFTINIFRGAAGRKLNSVECHDIVCKVADVVICGGVRRSALLSLSNLTDERMQRAKSGEWWNNEPQRALSNNSVAYTETPDIGIFMREWINLYDSKSGERGIFNRVACQRWAPERRDPDHEFGTNPSLRAGTKVWTDSGIFPIEELENKEFVVRNLRGELSNARCWLSGRKKPLYEVELYGGHKYYATAEHEWPVIVDKKTREYQKYATSDLRKGMYLPTSQGLDTLTNGHKGTYDDGFTVGWNLGDGWITERVNDSDKRQQIGFIVSEEDKESGIDEKLVSYLSSQCAYSGAGFKNRNEINVNNKKLESKFSDLGVTHKSNGLPSMIWSDSSEDFRRGLLDGLFSSDGSVCSTGKNRPKQVVLKSVHKKLIDDVSELLGFYGIKHSIRGSVTSNAEFPNKKDYDRQYTCYTLSIRDVSSKKRFSEIVTLSHSKKQSRLVEDIQHINEVGQLATDNENLIKIKNVRLTNIQEDVWDISVKDETHCFQLSQCITGNCSEIVLRSKQFCNLTEVIIRPNDTLDDLKRKVRLSTILGTMQATLTDFRYLSKQWKINTEEERLLGVSLTGIMDHKTLSQVNPSAERFLREMKQTARETNEKFADIYDIPPSAAITCVKPSGCTTLETKIQTENGVMSMADIFTDLAPENIDIFEQRPGTWIEPTKDLRVYDENDDLQRISKLYINGVSEVYELTDENGVVYKFTGNHKLKTDNGWKRVDELVEGDNIVSFDK